METEITDKQHTAEGGSDVPTCSSVAAFYNWLPCNLLADTWEDEVKAAARYGYELVPPNYHIPHFSAAMSMGDSLPKLYVMRLLGDFQELKTHFDRPARDIAYPLFFRKNAKAMASADTQTPPKETTL